MKQHRSNGEAASDHETFTAAPGKRAMTDSLAAPVQRQASANAPVQLMPAPAQTADDAFGLHLDAPENEPKWVKRARAYHRENPKYAEQFKEATDNACCGAGGELDPNEIARWQVSHGVKPDGICGPNTAAAAVAKKSGDAPAPAPNAAPVKVDVDAPLPPPAPANADPAETMKSLKHIGTNIANAADNVFDNIIDIFTGGNANAPKPGGGGNANANADAPTPTPTAPPVPSEPKNVPAAPTHAPVEQGDIGELTDATLRDIAASTQNPVVKDLAGDLAGLVESFNALHAAKKNGAEERGGARDKYVANVGEVRKKLAALKGEAAFKAAAYRLIASIGTYYSQSRNIDILESPPPKDTRTCNITSLAMALEGLGISAASYTGSKEKVQAAAKFYSHKITGDATSKAGAVDAVNGQGVSWSQLVGMRLSDFLELAAIARSMPDTSDDGVKAGAKAAWDSILSIGVLKELGGKFGAGGSTKTFDATGAKSGKGSKSDLDRLSSFGKSHRKDVEKYINARNNGEDLSKLQAGYDKAMADTSIDEQLSIETYRDYVIEHIGADLEAGGSIVIALTGHYAKLQAIVADGIIVNDPARDSRAACKLTWKEARAMGYFKYRLVLT